MVNKIRDYSYLLFALGICLSAGALIYLMTVPMQLFLTFLLGLMVGMLILFLLTRYYPTLILWDELTYRLKEIVYLLEGRAGLAIVHVEPDGVEDDSAVVDVENAVIYFNQAVGLAESPQNYILRTPGAKHEYVQRVSPLVFTDDVDSSAVFQSLNSAVFAALYLWMSKKCTQPFSLELEPEATLSFDLDLDDEDVADEVVFATK